MFVLNRDSMGAWSSYALPASRLHKYLHVSTSISDETKRGEAKAISHVINMEVHLGPINFFLLVSTNLQRISEFVKTNLIYYYNEF